MSVNQTWDSLDLGNLDLGYNHLERELSPLPRLVNGQNTLVTTGGKLRRRYGTIQPFGASTLNNYRIDRAIIYETMEVSSTGVTQNPPHVYIVTSAFSIVNQVWEVHYCELKNAPQSVISFTELRNSSGLEVRGNLHSLAPHEFVIARGKCYIKGTPSLAIDATGLGSVIFDGTGGTINVYPWGTLPPASGPSQPIAQLLFLTGVITTSITSIATTFTLTGNYVGGAPSTPFTIFIDSEQISITGISGGVVSSCNRGVNNTIATYHSANTIATAMYTPSGTVAWTASDNTVTINFGWFYTACFKSATGQYTNRTFAVPFNATQGTIPFTNFTGYLQGLFLPKMAIVYPAVLQNTTNYPTIAILRTTDGGGTFYELDEITNDGSGNITYVDNLKNNNLYSNVASTTNTPVPDFYLTGFAPTLTSNSPPPSVIAPQVVGVNAPVTCTPMAYFQGRIWYGIGNILFFSAQEEVLLGVPEECWPSGVNGNFWRLQNPIVAMISTSSTLYVWTYQHTYAFTGNSLNTFTYQPIFEGFGMNPLQSQAFCRFGENVAFMTQDYRVCTIQNGMLNVISDPLDGDLINFATAGGNNAQFQIKYYSTINREWLVVCGNNLLDNGKSRQWVYDLKKARGATSEKEPAFGGMYTPTQNFWYTPWNINSSCCLVSRQSPVNTTNGLYFFVWDSTLNQSQLVIQQVGTTTDQMPSGVATYDVDMQFNMNRVVTGDHVNEKRMPGITPPVYKMTLDRTIFPGDTDPDVYYFKDDTWNNAIPCNTAENPARREPSIGYKTLEYPVNEVAQRVAFEIKKVGSADDFELQNMQILWEPEGGA